MRIFTWLLLVISTTFFSSYTFAQTGTITKYFDVTWKPTSIDKAFYITDFVKEENSLYKTSSYWAKSRKVYKKAFFADTNFSKAIGLSITYYEDGQIEDSVFYNNDGVKYDAYHYYPAGQLRCHYVYSKVKGEKVEGFDINGNKIDDFIYEREAVFPDGNTGWVEYLASNIKDKLFSKNGAPEGKYTVVIVFAIGKDGHTANIAAETSNGYGMEEEAIRVIKKSPKWECAVQFNKPVNAYRRQPLTFLIEKQ